MIINGYFKDVSPNLVRVPPLPEPRLARRWRSPGISSCFLRSWTLILIIVIMLREMIMVMVFEDAFIAPDNFSKLFDIGTWFCSRIISIIIIQLQLTIDQWNVNVSFSAKSNQLKTLKVQLHFWFAEFWQNCDCRDTEAFLKMRTTGAWRFYCWADSIIESQRVPERTPNVFSVSRRSQGK